MTDVIILCNYILNNIILIKNMFLFINGNLLIIDIMLIKR